MNRRLKLFIVAAALTTSLVAEEAPQILEKVVYPLKGDDGRKEGEIRGERATVSSEGLVHIEGLVWEAYSSDDSIQMIVTTPECRYNTKTKVISSYSDVKIERHKAVMTGTGYICDIKKRKLTIVNNAKVVLRGMELWRQKTTSEEQ
jgi:LPS export ABC transporter protein LptC